MKLWILIYQLINEKCNPCNKFLEIFLNKVTHPIYLILKNVDKNWNSIFTIILIQDSNLLRFFRCFYEKPNVIII